MWMELTNAQDKKVMLNATNVLFIEDTTNGSKLTFNSGLVLNVKETHKEIEELIQQATGQMLSRKMLDEESDSDSSEE